jgi:hypothetical protein
MKAAKINVQEAVCRRALDLLYKMRSRDCDDAQMWADRAFIVAHQCYPDTPPEIKQFISEALLRNARDPGRLGRLMKAARRARMPDVRECVLAAYIAVIVPYTVAAKRRFPYVREIQQKIKSRDDVAPDKRVIRRICDELSLPLTTKPGRPKN